MVKYPNSESVDGLLTGAVPRWAFIRCSTLALTLLLFGKSVSESELNPKYHYGEFTKHVL